MIWNTTGSKGRGTRDWFAHPSIPPSLHPAPRGFTLIETMVAVSLLSVAIVAPMALTMRSLAAAYYARDQVTAFHLAQEAIESIRHARDHNILRIAFGDSVDLLSDFPSTSGNPFTVDTADNSMELCLDETCPPLKEDPVSGLYGYYPTWNDTAFTRTVYANFVGGGTDEVEIRVVVSWKTGAFQSQSVSITNNLYRWVDDGVAE